MDISEPSTAGETSSPMSSQITAKESVCIQDEDVENDQFIVSQNISLHSVTVEDEEQQMYVHQNQTLQQILSLQLRGNC